MSYNIHQFHRLDVGELRRIQSLCWVRFEKGGKSAPCDWKRLQHAEYWLQQKEVRNDRNKEYQDFFKQHKVKHQ